MSNPFIPDTLAAMMEVARQRAAEKDRERVIIGHIYDIPPAQLSDEEIRKFEREIWMRRIVASIPVLPTHPLIYPGILNHENK